MKTNSKIVRDEVKKYILECINVEYFEECNEAPTAKNVLKRLRKAYNYEYNMKRFPCEQDRFKDYMLGLPSELNIEYYNEGIEDLLINRFKIGEPKKRDADKAVNLYYYLIFVELKKLAENEDKQSAKILDKIEKSFKKD